MRPEPVCASSRELKQRLLRALFPGVSRALDLELDLGSDKRPPTVTLTVSVGRDMCEVIVREVSRYRLHRVDAEVRDAA